MLAAEKQKKLDQEASLKQLQDKTDRMRASVEAQKAVQAEFLARKQKQDASKAQAHKEAKEVLAALNDQLSKTISANQFHLQQAEQNLQTELNRIEEEKKAIKEKALADQAAIAGFSRRTSHVFALLSLFLCVVCVFSFVSAAKLEQEKRVHEAQLEAERLQRTQEHEMKRKHQMEKASREQQAAAEGRIGPHREISSRIFIKEEAKGWFSVILSLCVQRRDQRRRDVCNNARRQSSEAYLFSRSLFLVCFVVSLSNRQRF